MNHRLAKSMEMQDRAKLLIPGMTQLLSKRPDRFSQGVWPGYFSKAKGSMIWDLDDNQYLDMSIGGIGANVLGFADPDVDEAVKQAVELGSSSSLNCPEEVELAEVLCRLHPWAQMVRYARTGGEAMAIAIRIARAKTGNDKIVFCGYHGWHDWYLAANLGTENALGEHLITGLKPHGVPKGLTGTAIPFRYNNIEELAILVDEHKNEIAAIVLEPIRSTEPEPGFLSEVKNLAAVANAVLIFDEISAGLRICPGGAHLAFEINPDIAVFSKALGNGYPIAAIIGSENVMQKAQDTFISSTNWTERLGPTAAIATINKFQKVKAHLHLIKIGKWVQECWREYAKKYGIEIQISGIPPLSHFEFQTENAGTIKALFVQSMLDQGILASNLFYSMYAHSEADIERYRKAVDTSFGEIASAVSEHSIQTKLRGEPAKAGFMRLA